MLDVSQPRPRPLSRWNSFFSFAFLPAVILLPVLLLWHQEVTANAEQDAITQIWQRVQAQGAYSFHADISQLTIQAATVNGNQ
jgi:hypothetical protein